MVSHTTTAEYESDAVSAAVLVGSGEVNIIQPNQSLLSSPEQLKQPDEVCGDHEEHVTPEIVDTPPVNNAVSEDVASEFHEETI
jgi:hypothetical protein